MSQLAEIKTNLIRAIQSETATSSEEMIFSTIVKVIYMDNLECCCNIFGIKSGMLMFDCMNPRLDSIDMNILPVDAVAKIKEQIEFAKKSKTLSR